MKRKKIGICLSIIVSISVFSSLCTAEEINFCQEKENNACPSAILDSFADAYVAEWDPTNNYGHVDDLHVLSQIDHHYNSYIKIDLTPIPQKTVIQYAILKLYVSGIDDNPVGRNINCHRVDENWLEDTITWDNAPDYNYYYSDTDQVPLNPLGKWMEWDVSADVQFIVNGDKQNYGWALVDPEMQSPPGAGVWFYAKEVNVEAKRPKLEINAHPEEPVIQGSMKIQKGMPLTLKLDTSDYDGNPIRYFVDWRDGGEKWTEYEQESLIFVSHIYEEYGSYTIRVKAQDDKGAESGFSFHTVIVPKNRAFNMNSKIFNLIINHFINSFPRIGQLIQIYK